MIIASTLSPATPVSYSTLPAGICKLGFMSELKDRAKEARTAAGYRTIPPFAKAIGISASAVYQIESGTTRTLNSETLAAYEKATAYNAEWIRTGKGPSKVVGSAVKRLIESAFESSQPVKHDVLTMAIQEVETVLEEAELELQVSKRAAVIASTYALLEQGIPTATVVQFIRAAVA